MALYNTLEEVSTHELVLRGLSSLGIILFGFLLGRLVNWSLDRISKKLELHKHIKKGFIDLTLFIIRWSIYITFINLALNHLEIPQVTDFVSTVLITIPAFAAGLLLLILGLALAFYLKKIIQISEEGAAWNFISQVVFYFVLMIVGIYALKTALLPLENIVRNSIIISSVVIYSAGIVYYLTKKQLRHH